MAEEIRTWKLGTPRLVEAGSLPGKLTITLEQDEAGAYVAECSSIPGCVSQGTTEQEALQNIREAIELCLEVRAEQGLPLTVRTH